MVRGQSPPACRLYGLLARDVPKGVLLRRGPTRRVQLILWHTDNDTFEEGQWFHGRIYEHSSDLSPDGSLFLYLARKNQTPEWEASRTTHQWTAISRPPYYTALALWPIGDEWDGGGMFLDNRTVWLCHQPEHLKHQQHKKLTLQASFRPSRFSEKLIRNGWSIEDTRQHAIVYKDHPDHQYRLVNEYFREAGSSIEKLSYLVNNKTNEQHLINDATWLDWDHQGRLVFTRDGKLFATKDPAIPYEVEMIADFNGNTPKGIIAPDWAHQWPEPPRS
jgi:hypothetical protein